mmetsp:Transcript_3388/g.9141  ORF Transcript_3388/g.9141 Transcript_3388/m.9141 type:complete len:229 (+) Transcript_3388:984-1670(+)
MEGARVVVGQAEAPHVVPVAASLVGDVVNNEHRARESEVEVLLVEGLQVHRQQSGVPVVGNVHQALRSIREAAAGHVPYRLDGRLAEQRTAPRDVHNATTVYVLGILDEARVVDEDEVDAVAVVVEVLDVNARAAYVEVNTPTRLAELVVVVVHRADGHDAVSSLHERFGQGLHDIAKSSLFREWRTLESGQHDVKSFLNVSTSRSHLPSLPHPTGGTRTMRASRVKS